MGGIKSVRAIRGTSGRHNMIHGHDMSQWVKATDLCFKMDSKSAIFSDGSYYVRGSYYVYHWGRQSEEEEQSKVR